MRLIFYLLNLDELNQDNCWCKLSLTKSSSSVASQVDLRGVIWGVPSRERSMVQVRCNAYLEGYLAMRMMLHGRFQGDGCNAISSLKGGDGGPYNFS